MKDKKRKPIKDIDFDGKYIINDAESKPYYTWSALNEDHIEKRFAWLDRLKSKNAISYESSFNKNELEREIGETGYIVPRFRFLEYIIDKNFIKEEDYSKTLSHFQLNSDGKLKFKDVHKISAFRDSLLKQIIRQADYVTEINQNLLDVLKVYYYETELAICVLDIPLKKKENLIDTLETHLWIQTEIFLRGASFEYIITAIEKWKKYPSEKYWKSAVNGLKKYCKTRSKILDAAAILVRQFLPYESLLEDAFMNSRIKTPEIFGVQQLLSQVRKFQGEQYWETAFKYYMEEKGWDNAYDSMVEEMEEIGLDIRHTSPSSLKNSYYRYLKNKEGD